MPLKVDFHHVIGDDPRAEIPGLLPHQFHQLGPADAVLRVRRHHRANVGGNGAIQIARQIAGGKPGVVFHFGGEIQLSQRERPADAVLFGNRSLEHHRRQLGPGRVDGRRPAGWSAANDHHFFDCQGESFHFQRRDIEHEPMRVRPLKMEENYSAGKCRVHAIYAIRTERRGRFDGAGQGISHRVHRGHREKTGGRLPARDPFYACAVRAIGHVNRAPVLRLGEG